MYRIYNVCVLSDDYFKIHNFTLVNIVPCYIAMSDRPHLYTTNKH